MADDGSSNLSVVEMLAKARAERLAWKREHAAKTAAEAAARRVEVDRMTARVPRADAGGALPGSGGGSVGDEGGPAVPEGGAWGIVFGASAVASDDAGDGAPTLDEPDSGDAVEHRSGDQPDSGVARGLASMPAPPSLLSTAVPKASDTHEPNDPCRPQSLDFGRVA